MEIVEFNQNEKPVEIIAFGTYPQTTEGAELIPDLIVFSKEIIY